MHPRVVEITQRIIERSKPYRELYLDRIAKATTDKPRRTQLACGNLAHGYAVCSPSESKT